jgi:hypothetical protein
MDVGRETDTFFLMDVAIGSSGNEVNIVTNLYFSFNSAESPNPGTFSIPIFIPKGSRVSVRAQCSTTTAASRTFDVVLYGIF